MSNKRLAVKILEFAAANVDSVDFEAVTGVNKKTVLELAKEISKSEAPWGRLLSNFKSDVRFEILMGVKSCYSAFYSKQDTLALLNISEPEWDSLDEDLRW